MLFSPTVLTFFLVIEADLMCQGIHVFPAPIFQGIRVFPRIFRDFMNSLTATGNTRIH